MAEENVSCEVKKKLAPTSLVQRTETLRQEMYFELGQETAKQSISTTHHLLSPAWILKQCNPQRCLEHLTRSQVQRSLNTDDIVQLSTIIMGVLSDHYTLCNRLCSNQFAATSKLCDARKHYAFFILPYFQVRVE